MTHKTVITSSAKQTTGTIRVYCPNIYIVNEGDAPVKKTAQNVNETQAEADFLAYPEG